jgi:GNAT superfamily N-acetyltransferase
MEIFNCSKADFDQILNSIVDFWGSDKTLHLHNPIFLYEFGNSAYVIKKAEQVVAYLFGFLSQTAPVGYVHLIAVHHSHRRKGLARHLYDHFAEFAREAGCREIKAITMPTNSESIAFHQGIGMELLGVPNEAGIPVARDYAGSGKHCVVFHKQI